MFFVKKKSQIVVNFIKQPINLIKIDQTFVYNQNIIQKLQIKKK